MSRVPLTHRVESLEQTVSGLDALPARLGELERSLAEFRKETRREFAAVRSELRDEIRSSSEDTRRYMRVLHGEVLDRIRMIDEGGA